MKPRIFQSLFVAAALLLAAPFPSGKAHAAYGVAPNLRINHQFDNTKTRLSFRDDHGNSHSPKVPGDHKIFVKNALGKDLNFVIRRDGGKISMVFHIDGPTSPVAYLTIQKPGGGHFSTDGVTYSNVPVHPAHQIYFYSEIEDGASGGKIQILNQYGNPAYIMTGGQDYHWKIGTGQEMRLETVTGKVTGPVGSFGAYGFFSVSLKKYPTTPSGKKSSLWFREAGQAGLTQLDVYPGTEIYIKGKPQVETPTIPLRVVASKTLLANTGDVSFTLRAYENSPIQVYTNPEYHRFTSLKLVRGDVVQEYTLHEDATQVTVHTGPGADTKYTKTGNWNSMTAIGQDEYLFFNMNSDEVRLGLVGESPSMGLQMGGGGPQPPTPGGNFAANPCALDPELCSPDDDDDGGDNGGDDNDGNGEGEGNEDKADENGEAGESGQDQGGNTNAGGDGSEDGFVNLTGSSAKSGGGCSLSTENPGFGPLGLLGLVLLMAPLGFRRRKARLH